MKLNKRSLLIISILALMCLTPFLFASGGGEAAVEGEVVPSYVRFITTIFGQEPGNPHRFFLFIGRFHPLVLHLPIGMVVIAFFMQVYGLWKKREDFYFPYCFVLGFGFVTACIAVLFGSLLAMSNDYNPELIDRHGWGGLLFAILVGIAFFLKVSFLRSGMEKTVHKKASIGVLAIAMGVMSFVGHDGGSLTHGPKYLFEHGPDWVRAIEGLPPYKEPGVVDPEGTVYAELVEPFLSKNCYECHSEAKSKGKLRLDSMDFIKQGGKTDDPKLIVHGDAEKSNMYQLMTTDDEDEIMPPEGMLPQTDREFIKWWIDSSKSDEDLFERKVKDADVPQQFMEINKRGKSAGEAHKGVNEKAEKPAEPEAEKKAEAVPADTKKVAETSGGIDFAKQIAPILEARCVKCHGEKKQKGEFRLDKAEFITKSGESEEKPVVAGKPAESYLVKLIKMTEDDDDVMPPKGGTLKPEEIALIVKWIEEGAKYPADLQLQDKSEK